MNKTSQTATSPTRLLDLIQMGALSLCFGVVFTTGLAAAIAFPTMHTLDPTLPSYAGMDDHWLIAAGAIMARIFNITANIQGVCLIVAALALIVSVLRVKPPRNTRAVMIRVGVLALALTIYTHYRAVLIPRMNTNFTSFLNAARARDLESAQSFRTNFDADHPKSGKELISIGVLSLIGAGSVGLPIAKRRSSGSQ